MHGVFSAGAFLLLSSDFPSTALDLRISQKHFFVFFQRPLCGCFTTDELHSVVPFVKNS